MYPSRSQSIKKIIASLLVCLLMIVNILSIAHELVAHKDEKSVCNDDEKSAHFHSLNHELSSSCKLCDFISSLLFVKEPYTIKFILGNLQFSYEYTYTHSIIAATSDAIHLRGPPIFFNTFF